MNVDQKHWLECASQEAFAEYFCKNYPGDTVIGRPEWHAPKIFNAATRALGLGKEPASEIQTLRATNEKLREALKLMIYEIRWHEKEIGLVLRGMGSYNVEGAEGVLVSTESAQ